MIGGVKIGWFFKRLPPLIWENFKINSAIEAVPFNIRYCSRNYKFDRKRLSAKLPILAQTNQDGNCYLITLISMIFIFLLGIEVSLLQVVGIAVLILFLSVGAPNQPGSVMVGILIISFYLGANDLVSIAIFAEVFFGALQNAINVIGDIVTVAIEEQKIQKIITA
jgi:Na+/H+-dicarboxylate symporter